MKHQVLAVGSGSILFESNNKEDCIKWQREHHDIRTFLWTNYGMSVAHL